ncbi:MAG: hypothetical protein ACKPEQ_27725 [Dolichospermum sp.]
MNVGLRLNQATNYKILRHLHSNHRGVVLTGNLAKPGSLTVSLG